MVKEVGKNSRHQGVIHYQLVTYKNSPLPKKWTEYRGVNLTIIADST